MIVKLSVRDIVFLISKDSQIILKWKRNCWNSPPYQKISWKFHDFHITMKKFNWKSQYLILSSKPNLFNNNPIWDWNQFGLEKGIEYWDFHLIFHENHQFFMIFFNFWRTISTIFLFSLVWESLDTKKKKGTTLSFTFICFRSPHSKDQIEYAVILCYKRKKSYCIIYCIICKA